MSADELDKLIERLWQRGKSGDDVAASAAVEMRRLRHQLAKTRAELAQVYNTNSRPCAFCPEAARS